MTARAALTLAIVLTLCALLPAQTSEVTDIHGAIVEVNQRNGWYGIVPDDDRGTRYAPDRLPDEFRKDGLRVIFSGRPGQVDPNVRTWGIPLTVTNIRLEPTP
jgi:hypothetical protein